MDRTPPSDQRRRPWLKQAFSGSHPLDGAGRAFEERRRHCQEVPADRTLRSRVLEEAVWRLLLTDAPRVQVAVSGGVVCLSGRWTGAATSSGSRPWPPRSTA